MQNAVESIVLCMFVFCVCCLSNFRCEEFEGGGALRGEGYTHCSPSKQVWLILLKEVRGGCGCGCGNCGGGGWWSGKRSA